MPCSNCGKEKVLARGLCSACYSRLKKRGTLQRARGIAKGRICEVEGCGHPVVAKGLCELHYQRNQNPAKISWTLLRSRNPGQYPAKWDSFEEFLVDVGARPSARHQLRKVDAAKPYSRENVEWLAPVSATQPNGWSTEDRAAYMREWNFRKKYGITGEEYDRMFAEQNGACAICQKPERQIRKTTGKIRALHVDHAHDESQRVRGLLCSDCNNGLGQFKDDPAILRAAAAYLESHAGPITVLGTAEIQVSEVRTNPDGSMSWTETPIA